MALGDGIRRNIKDVDPSERALLRDAIKELNHRFFPGTRTDSPPGGVSWWFKQDEIHQSTHVHGGPEFVPWHRIIVNRFEELIRQVNPQLSLHYWDFNDDPASLFTSNFMGSGSGEAGAPWKDEGFYDPDAGTSGHPLDRDATGNPFDPPTDISRSLNAGALLPISDISPGSAFGTVCPIMAINNDDDILSAVDYAELRVRLECVHNFAHGHIGGTLNDPHISFRDPVVFLVHSNVDRLFARWQTDPAHPERLEPTTVYGSESGDAELSENVEPWSTGVTTDSFGVDHITRPWSGPENQGVPFNYKHPSVVAPPCYDTNHSVNGLVEVMNVGTPPVILFNDIPEGETGARAASFRIWGCRDVTLQATAVAAPFSILLPASGLLSAPHEDALYTEARIWFGMTAPDPAALISDQNVTISCAETGQSFSFILRGSVIEKPTVATMLVLDQSGSMNDPAGTSGRNRLDVLKDAARAFAELLPAGDGVGIVRFDENAYNVDDATYPGLAINTIASDGDFDPQRISTIVAVNAHGAHGNTSVGDGVAKGRDYLNAIPAGTYQQKAMVVFTDGIQNEPQSIEDVAGSIDNRTFAIGLGNDMQVDTGALWDLTHATGGFLLLTGLLTDSIDDLFRTKKYFLQILSGVTNDDVVLDPNGYIGPGQTVHIPFHLNETDIQCTAILMWDYPVIDFMIETPSGALIDMASAAGLGITAKLSDSSGLYRFTLPVALGAGEQVGQWHVVLKINEDKYKKYTQKDDKRNFHGNSLAKNGARYSVQINTRSNLKMTVRVDQSDFTPGSVVKLKTVLTEYGIPIAHRAACVAEVTSPDGSRFDVPMTELVAGEFEAAFNTSLVGIYVIRFVVNGATLRGKTFTREQTRNAIAQRQKGTGGNSGTTNGGTQVGSNDGLTKAIAYCCRRSTLLMVVAIILLVVIVILLWKSML
jgi:hypothetical protein